jgi:2'-5' RNA ligase
MAMPDVTRTFIAIALPEPIERELAKLQAELAPALPDFRCAVALPFHMTLAFLGDVPNRDLKEICSAAASGAKVMEPFEIQVEGLGAFPNPSRPRVVWAGLTSSNSTVLQDLQRSIVRSVAAIGYRPDLERFHPHITLGRIRHDRRRAPDLTALIERHRRWSAGRTVITEVTVFASTLGPAGPRYDVLGRGVFLSKKTEAQP